MTYGTLPFAPKETDAIVNGEPVATTTKRAWSAIIDYGTLFSLYIGSKVFSDWYEFDTWFLFWCGVINSIVLQGLTGYSLGRFVTNSTLLCPFGRTGFARPGWRIVLRYSLHLLVYFLVYLYVNAPDSSEGCTDWSECPPPSIPWLGWVLAIVALAYVVALEKHPLRQSPPDLLAKTVVVNRRMGPVELMGSGRELR